MYRHPTQVFRNNTNYHSTVENSKCDKSSASNSGNKKDGPSVAPAKPDQLKLPPQKQLSQRFIQAIQPRMGNHSTPKYEWWPQVCHQLIQTTWNMFYQPSQTSPNWVCPKWVSIDASCRSIKILGFQSKKKVGTPPTPTYYVIFGRTSGGDEHNSIITAIIMFYSSPHKHLYKMII